MIESQIISRGITDEAVIRAMRRVKRHLFVPPHQRPFAYVDDALSIGCGQTISQPYIVAYMTEKLRLEPDFRVLEIGCGSGYQSAVLSEIVREVYSVEIIRELGEKTVDRFERLGYPVQVRIGDGWFGWEERAPFDAVIVTAASEKVPPPLVEQLAEGGRMIIPIGEEGSVQRLVLIRKESDRAAWEDLLPVRFVPFTRG